MKNKQFLNSKLRRDSEDLESTFSIPFQLLVHEAIVLFTKGGVFVVARGGCLQDAVQKAPRRRSHHEAEGGEAINLIVLLGHHQVVATNAIGVPPGSHSHTGG